MKEFLFSVLIIISLTGFSQTIEDKSFGDKYEEFDFYAKPSKKNNLSKYFRKTIDMGLLDAIKFPKKEEYKKRIFLTFIFNRKNKVTNIKVNSPYSELNNSIKEAFKNYDIKNLNIPEINGLNIYVVQVISREEGETIINCSTNIVYDRYPVFEGCESITSYSRMKSCINKKLESHIVKHISLEEIKKAKVLGFLELKPEFLVDEKGNIKGIKSKAPTENLTNELNRIVALFPKAKLSSTRNGKPSALFYKGYVSLIIDSEDGKYEEEVLKSNDSIFNPNNDLALHFKKYLNEENLKGLIFRGKQKNISLNFGINKKGQLIEVKTTSKDPKLNNKIVQIFKRFPMDKLNINPTNLLVLYSYNVITRVNDKNVIECNDKPLEMIYPFFNKKCEKSKSPEDLRNCLAQNISAIIKRKFDKDMYSRTKLRGDIRIYALFKIDPTGQIVDVKVRAPNPFLVNETEEILKGIPKMFKPAYKNGKAMTIKFSLPIRYAIRSKKPEDTFKSLNKKRY